MRVLDGDQFLVRIFLGESDTWRHTPLVAGPPRATPRRRLRGSDGDSRCRGIRGQQRDSYGGAARFVDDLPVVIEVVDDQAHVDRLLPILDEMIVGGALVTMERVRVEYAVGPKRESRK